MQLIPADALTEHDKEMRRVLNEHPDIKERLAHLIHRYYSLINNCLEQMSEAYIDVADTEISLSKLDTATTLLGIPLNPTASIDPVEEKHEITLEDFNNTVKVLSDRKTNTADALKRGEIDGHGSTTSPKATKSTTKK